jgi:GNAT superfamily N-acetyltransferase
MKIVFYDPTWFEPLADALHELDQHYFGQQGASREAVAAHLHREMLGPDSGVQIVLAADGQRVAALATFALLYPAPQQRAQLFMKDLYVCHAWRGQRVGERIMQFLAQHAMAKNCVRFDWTTETDNPRAMQFYERLGAERVTSKVYYRASGDALERLARGKP